MFDKSKFFLQNGDRSRMKQFPKESSLHNKSGKIVSSSVAAFSLKSLQVVLLQE